VNLGQDMYKFCEVFLKRQINELSIDFVKNLYWSYRWMHFGKKNSTRNLWNWIPKIWKI